MSYRTNLNRPRRKPDRQTPRGNPRSPNRAQDAAASECEAGRRMRQAPRPGRGGPRVAVVRDHRPEPVIIHDPLPPGDITVLTSNLKALIEEHQRRLLTDFRTSRAAFVAPALFRPPFTINNIYNYRLM